MRIATNIRNDSGIQRLRRGGLSVVGSAARVAPVAMLEAYTWNARM
jgi:hypothetical protein